VADGADEVEGVAGAAAEEAHELRELEAPQQRPMVYGVELPGAGRMAERGLRSALSSATYSDRILVYKFSNDQCVSRNIVAISGLGRDLCRRT